MISYIYIYINLESKIDWIYAERGDGHYCVNAASLLAIHWVLVGSTSLLAVTHLLQRPRGFAEVSCSRVLRVAGWDEYKTSAQLVASSPRGRRGQKASKQDYLHVGVHGKLCAHSTDIECYPSSSFWGITIGIGTTTATAFGWPLEGNIALLTTPFWSDFTAFSSFFFHFIFRENR